MVMLWLDDNRPAPAGWLWCRSVNQALQVFSDPAIEVTHASLDNDLGPYVEDGGFGEDLVNWLEEHGIWPTSGLRIHSANSVAGPRMFTAANVSGPYPHAWLRFGGHPTLGTAPAGGWPERTAAED